MLTVNNRLKIPLKEFDFTFARSGGPGGQHVNKVNTKATLRWDVAKSPSVSDAVRRRFMQKNRRRITKDGEFIITSQRYRDQGRNVADCLAKLRELLEEATVVPKVRKKTKPSRTAKRRRVKNKRIHSRKKKLRKPPKLDD